MTAAVTVRNDPTYGMLAAVRVTAPAGAAREAIQTLQRAFGRIFQIRHAVEFAAGTT
jgi:hypothetical protein